MGGRCRKSGPSHHHTHPSSEHRKRLHKTSRKADAKCCKCNHSVGQKMNGLDLGSGGETRGRSSSPFRTILALLRNQEGHPHGPGDGERKPHWGAFEYLWGVCLCEPTTKQNKHRPASRRCGNARWSARSCAAMLGVKVEQVNAKLGKEGGSTIGDHSPFFHLI